MSRDLERALHYHKISYWQPAVDAYDKVLAEHPDNMQVLAKRAENYILLGRFDEAVRDFKIAAPALDESPAWVNLGLAVECQGNYEAALICYDRALELDPSNKFAHFNKGVCLERDLGIVGGGMPHFERALEIDPGFNGALGGLSFHQLKVGNYAEGWRNFEYRTRDPNATRLPGLPFDGNATDDTLILVCEQGLGDIIQFCRYAMVAVLNGQKTAIYAPPAFKSLLSSLTGVRILTKPEEVVEPYQWTYLMSMPMFMGTQVATIPATRRYLSSSRDRQVEWKMRMRPYAGTFNIGICWHPGHPQNPHVAGRVIPLKMFEEIAAIPNVRLFCLQKEEAAKERDEVDFEVIDLGGDPVPKHELFMDNAALMENLDLVISTDSAVLHAACAVGAKTFGAIPKGGCWRWLVDRDTSPWYPTLQLFRQTEVRDWRPVFSAMTAEVAKLAKEKLLTPPAFRS